MNSTILCLVCWKAASSGLHHPGSTFIGFLCIVTLCRSFKIVYFFVDLSSTGFASVALSAKCISKVSPLCGDAALSSLEDAMCFEHLESCSEGCHLYLDHCARGTSECGTMS